MNLFERKTRVPMQAAILFLSMAFGAYGQRQPSNAPADLVFQHGKIITMDGQDQIVSAVAVIGNRIVAVGTDQEIEPWVGRGTTAVDLQGKSLLPGFIDAHSHVEGLAVSEHYYVPIQAPPLRGPAEIIAKLKERAATLPRGTWIVGQGTYNQVMPSREELDKALPDHPVVLRWSAHDWLYNHQADLAAGLTKERPDPKGMGRFERNSDGEVVISRDAAVELPVPPPTYEQLSEWIPVTLTDFYVKHGVTTVYDMSSPLVAYRIYQTLKEQNKLPCRMVISYMIGPNDLFGAKEGATAPTADGPRAGLLDSLLKTGMHTGFGDDWIRVGAIKIILDGVWGTTAAIYKPVWEGSGTTWIADNHGGVSRSQEVLSAQILAAHKNGWQVWVHANGDRAQDMTLTAYKNAQKEFPRNDARDRIEHFAHFLTQDPERTQDRLQRMLRDRVIPSPQPAFLWRLTDVNIKEPDVKFFPMKTLIDLGMHPSGGSDTLGTQNYATNPLFSISRAVLRTTKYGALVQPEEAISVLDGIRMFTTWAAYSGFQEKTRGSIETGKLADLVVLSGNPLTVPHEKLMDLNVDMTVLDGKIVYRRQ
jgi:predicted amidohydrolase YtcJ